MYRFLFKQPYHTERTCALSELHTLPNQLTGNTHTLTDSTVPDSNIVPIQRIIKVSLLQVDYLHLTKLIHIVPLQEF